MLSFLGLDWEKNNNFAIEQIRVEKHYFFKA